MSERSYQLVVRKGPKPGEVFTLSSSNISIGRDPMSDVTISDPEVSRYHAQLIRTETGYQIQDMDSTNGTYVEGVRLGSEPAPLIPGKAIQFGSGIILDYKITGIDDAAMATVIDMSHEPLVAAEPIASEESTQAEVPVDIPPLPDLEEPPAPPILTSPPVSETPPGPPPTSPPPVIANEGDSKRRRNMIIILAVVLLLCCCCALVFSIYNWGGDIFLNWLAQQGLNIPGVIN